MRRVTFIFIVLSLNCLAGYFLDYPLTLFLLHPLIEGMGWDPLSKYLLVAVPLAIALPIVLGDAIFKLCVVTKRYLHEEDVARFRVYIDKFVDGIVWLCVIIMLGWAAFPPKTKSFAFDKRSYVFDQMYRRYRGLPIYEREDCGISRQINNFKGTILQHAGADGLWNTSDDVIRLENSHEQNLVEEGSFRK